MAEEARASAASAGFLGLPFQGQTANSSPTAVRHSDPPVAEVQGFPSPSGPVDLVVRRGDVVLLRGPNGCGKTSLLRALAGLDGPLRPRAVQVAGSDPRTLAAPRLAQALHAIWSDPRAGLVGLTLAGEARLRRMPMPGSLAHLRDRDVATLSDGESRRVALAFAAASRAPLLLLDEPYDALDDAGARLVDALVADGRASGAVVLADHTGRATRLATRIVDLAPSTPSRPEAFPAGTGPPILCAPAATVQRGRRTLHLPALRLPAGAHAVTGPNGAGKSTLLRRLAGLQDSDGVAVADAPAAAGDNTRLLLPGAGELATGATVRDELDGAGDRWGLVPPALLGRHPLSLSAGEAQRVALAKALGRPAPVHLLDEPEAHLDADGRARLAAAIKDRVAAGACVVVATHDVGGFASRVQVPP